MHIISSLSLLYLLALDGGGEDYVPPTLYKFHYFSFFPRYANFELQLSLSRYSRLKTALISLPTSEIQPSLEDLRCFKQVSSSCEDPKVIWRCFKQEPSFISSFNQKPT
ncbi:hypothetical protein HanRHA438_Chr11g0509541 [Helianthus annuus]|nr:hypothetical protein HanRHA438_Chr11g0509541 [Helianthus annuus]